MLNIRQWHQKIRQQLYQLIRQECRCEMCLDPLSTDDSCVFLCHSCLQDLPRIHNPCVQCGEPISDNSSQPQLTRCSRCQQQPPAFDYCYSNYRYHPPLNFWIRQGKDKQRLEWMIRLAGLMQLSPPPMLHQVDAFLYVPSHWQQLLRRGYNPAAILCEQLHHQTGIPLIKEAVLKRHHQDQRQLDAHERRQKISASLACGELDLDGLHLLLIEDVVTTGATADAVARLLKEQGAAIVGVWALARTAPKNTPL
jgi:ComF family protein